MRPSYTPFLLLLKFTLSAVTLISSNTVDTIVYFPGPEGPAAAVAIYDCGGLSGATVIWHSTEAEVIEVKQHFRIKCLTNNLYLNYQVDDYFWYTFQGQTTWNFVSSFNCGGSLTITRNFQCNKSLIFYAKAQNTNDFSFGNYGLAYQLSQPDCFGCNTTAFFKTDECTCLSCNYFDLNCKTCDQLKKCLTCVNNTYTVVDGACPTCLSLIAGCLTCQSPLNCTLCDLASHFIGTPNNLCFCQVGYSLTCRQCLLCSSLIANCFSCSSPSTCPGSSQCLSCVNNTYTVVDGACPTCLSLIAGCLTCLTNQVCLTCNESGQFRLTRNNCSCISGFVLSDSSCIECNCFMPKCQKCSSPKICLQCESGYKLNLLQCQLVVYSRLNFRLALALSFGLFGMVLLMIGVAYCKIRKSPNIIHPAEVRKIPVAISGNCHICGHSHPELIISMVQSGVSEQEKCMHLYHWSCLLQASPLGQWKCGTCNKSSKFAHLSCEDCSTQFGDLRFPYLLTACGCSTEKDHFQCILNQIRKIKSNTCPFKKQN